MGKCICEQRLFPPGKTKLTSCKHFPLGIEVIVPTVDLSPREETYYKNILVMPKGYIAPRTPDNLKKLLQYARRKWGNPTDKRTRAYKQWYRFMVLHDSEFLATPKEENNG